MTSPEENRAARHARFLRSPQMEEYRERSREIAATSRITFGNDPEWRAVCAECGGSIFQLTYKDGKEAFTYSLAEIASLIYLHHVQAHNGGGHS